MNKGDHEMNTTDKLAAALWELICISKTAAWSEGSFRLDDALEDARIAYEEYAAEGTPRLVITMVGGIIQDLSAHVPGIEAVLVDYDTEGADADDGVVQIAQLNWNGTVRGYEDAFVRRADFAVNAPLVATRFKEAEAGDEGDDLEEAAEGGATDAG
jgi:hypothetical protein